MKCYVWLKIICIFSDGNDCSPPSSAPSSPLTGDQLRVAELAEKELLLHELSLRKTCPAPQHEVGFGK